MNIELIIDWVINLRDFSSFYSKIQFILHWHGSFLPYWSFCPSFWLSISANRILLVLLLYYMFFLENLYAYLMLSIHHFKIIPQKYSNQPLFVYFLNSTYKPSFYVQFAPINFGNSNTLRNQSKTHSKFKIYQHNSTYENRSASQKP